MNRCYWCGHGCESIHPNCWKNLKSFALSNRVIPTKTEVTTKISFAELTGNRARQFKIPLKLHLGRYDE